MDIAFKLRIFRCPECDFAASKRNALDQHTTSTHRARNILCPHCPRRVSTEAKLRAHIKLKHEGKAETEAGNTNGYAVNLSVKDIG